jgi:2-amino-4-hydroxy-6-hydroxymethyldihydropteridine diphosphokinase
VNTSQAVIALGSNLGDSLAILEGAIQAIASTGGITMDARSSWYQTPPIGPVQPDYLNGCVLITVKLTPQELLEKLLAIEQQFGRVRSLPWGPRTLDLDIILFGDLILDTPGLKIPHPRMSERAFVLIPLAEIAPDRLDPRSDKTITQLLSGLDCSGIKLFNSP